MDDVTRRNAIKLAAAAGVVAAVGATAGADDKKTGKLVGSGTTVSDPKSNMMELEVGKAKVRELANGLNSFFSRTTPDGSPGRNVLTINGLPAGTRVISVWITEWSEGNKPHAGGAFFYTTSVQLYNDGTQCRVIFNLDWSDHLATGCQVIYGPG